MTLPELLANEELRRHEFPVACDKIFLAHAGVCPLPRRVAEAIRAYANQCTLGDQETILPVLSLHELRRRAARLLQADAEEIAFVAPTSQGLSVIAAGLEFKREDEVLIYFDDYPSNVYPWMALAKKGVRIRYLQAPQLGAIRLEQVEEQLTERTRLVALASCHFISGFRVDLPAIGQCLRRRQILFCVDAIQTIGAFPTSVAAVDFLAADAHKWMLGPCASGLLYVRKSLQDQLNPTALGWNNVRSPNFITQPEIRFRADARRYEPGTHNLLGLVGLQAALDLLSEIGVDNIGAELLRKRAWLVPELQAKGFLVLNADAPAPNASAIISLYCPGTNLAPLHQRLLDANIITSLRADRSGQQYLRLSPHFYNSDQELHRLLEQL